MEETLSKFAEVVAHPYKRLSAWKQRNGQKVIGCFPMHVPEELIHAAGCLPVTIFGSDEAATLVDKHLPPYLCHPVRSGFDLALKGGLDALDGTIFPDICDQVQCISDSWQMHCPASFYRNLVIHNKLNAPSSREYLVRHLNDVKAALESFTGHQISEGALRESIAIYNRNRALLRRLYQLRRDNPGLWRARDMVNIVAASMLMPKEEHSQLLAGLLEQARSARPQGDGRVRVVVSGSLCDVPGLGFLDLVEELGVVVADDDLYVGRRYFATPVDEALPPIEALAGRYLSDVPCPTKHNPDNDWGDYLINLVHSAQAKGVIHLVFKFCEPHGFDYPYLKRRLAAAGIPEFMIETEGEPAPSGAVKTRVQTFIEILRGM